MSLKIYGAPISGHVNPIIALCTENSIPFELIPTNPMAGETKTPEFLKLNPMHCIPTIDDDGFTLCVLLLFIMTIRFSNGLVAGGKARPF